ncbi:hypothetical protein MMC31_004798 [Peltigera leucophlebia]|nr:hypothetical protein [Peltigera leucophlebia]
MAQMTGATRHENRHSVVETYNDVTFVVKLLVAEKTFKETLSRGSGNNGENTNIDLFQKGTAALAGGIPLQNYIRRARGNWTQAGTQVAEGDGKIEQDLFDENLDNLVEHVSVQDDDDE